MAIAGDNIPAFYLRIADNRLIVGGTHNCAKHLVEHDLDKAVSRLRKGETIYLHKYGMNLATVKEALKAEGVQA